MSTRCSATAAALAVLGLTTACAGPVTSSSSASRAELYGSLAELTAASSLVVAGVAGDQRTAADVTPTLDSTLTAFEVAATVEPEDGPSEGRTIVVRQTGSADQPPPAGPLLEPGRAYLLFLTASGLPGELAEQFYVTGVTAGLYTARDPASVLVASGDWGTAVFDEAAAGEGDVLPDAVTAADVPRSSEPQEAYTAP